MMIGSFLFYIFAGLVLLSALMVVLARNPVHGVLFLVLTFVLTAFLWMLLQAEFLSLVLVFVYVGAVMTLFLFVVMMMDIDIASLKQGFVKYLPIGAFVVVFMTLLMLAVLHSQVNTSLHQWGPPYYPTHYNNTLALGKVLYTHYVYAFELAAAILLAAIGAAISLTFRGVMQRKRQSPQEQVAVSAKDRLRIVSMKPEKPAEQN